MDRSTLNALLDKDYGSIAAGAQDFVREYVTSCNSGGVVVGLSGGLDSSVVATLCVRSLGPGKVFGLVMPAEATPAEDEVDAISLARSLSIQHARVPLNSIIADFGAILPPSPEKKPMGNLTSRLRLIVLYYYAAIRNSLVVGTSDRSEILIGYFTKFGDGSADMQPIASLYKSQVKALARHLQVHANIIAKKSSPRLWPNHEAEKEIGVDYETVDSVLHLLVDEKMEQVREIARLLDVNDSLVAKIKHMVEGSAHKRQMPPAPKVA